MAALPRRRLGRLERAALQGVMVREVVNYSSFWRSSTFSSTVDPTIYLLAFGFGFGSLVSQVAGYDYIDFVGTGIVATTVLFSGAFPAMYSTFVKYQFQHTYDAILAAPVDTEELVTGESLWIAARTGVYGCVPMLVAMVFGLNPSWGVLARAVHRGAVGLWLGQLRNLRGCALAGNRELLVLAERPADAALPRGRHLLPAERAAGLGTGRGQLQPALPLRRASTARIVRVRGLGRHRPRRVPDGVRTDLVAIRNPLHGEAPGPVTGKTALSTSGGLCQ